MKNRAGQFTINWDYINTEPEEVLRALKDVIIVRAEHDLMDNSIAYVGLSKNFRELDQGEKIPKYKVLVTLDTVEWVSDD